MFAYQINVLCVNQVHRPVGLAETRSPLALEVWGSNLGPVKSDTVLPTTRHRCNISSKGAVLPGRNDPEMGSANSLHASAYYSEYNERFDLINQVLKNVWIVLTLEIPDIFSSSSTTGVNWPNT